ncbi:unnamed protein product [Absidia cylindrospora]
MSVWEQLLCQSGFRLKATCERNTLTDAILSPINNNNNECGPTLSSSIRHPNDQQFIKDTPIHIKVIGRHMNGSFRCHIGTGKASRPIQSQELGQQMRLLAVFFRAANSKSQLVSPDFIFFPTWLFHLFRYTQYDTSPGRTDVRFLEDASLAKEDHIYRLNHVLNSLFRFSLHNFNIRQLWDAVALANFLFDHVGLNCFSPSPATSSLGNIIPPALYSPLISHLHAPRPLKSKPMCSNCNTKTASRRKLCVACYRYHLKHGELRPLRLIVTNQSGSAQQQHYDTRMDAAATGSLSSATTTTTIKSFVKPALKKYCANCGVQETHQWYRNLCGQGHWCETCKSYYLRHDKAAKRKVDVPSLVSWATWAWDHQQHDHHQQQQQQQQQQRQNQDVNSNQHCGNPSTISHKAVPTHDHYYDNNDNNIVTVDTSATSWAPSGCRPHLYHPRNTSISSGSGSGSDSGSGSGSRCNSPSSVSLPSTPPSSNVHPSFLTSHDCLPTSSAMINDKHMVTSLPSLSLAFTSGTDYVHGLFDCI